LLDRLPVTGDILRGSLLTRTIRNHAKGCAKCASGEGHPLAVLTVTYPGARARQFSLRPERVAEVRRWLAASEGHDVRPWGKAYTTAFPRLTLLRRATSEMFTSGSALAARIRAFSASLQSRRRRRPVITSTR
jgi:hypothetical protein